jgi:inosine-uridine nucleoside N-ribohydrolase
MHDPVALSYALRPELLEVRPAHVEVDCSWGLGRGRTNVDFRGRGGEPNADVAVGIDSPAFIRFLVERISALG